MTREKATFIQITANTVWCETNISSTWERHTQMHTFCDWWNRSLPSNYCQFISTEILSSNGREKKYSADVCAVFISDKTLGLSNSYCSHDKKHAGWLLDLNNSTNAVFLLSQTLLQVYGFLLVNPVRYHKWAANRNISIIRAFFQQFLFTKLMTWLMPVI